MWCLCHSALRCRRWQKSTIISPGLSCSCRTWAYCQGLDWCYSSLHSRTTLSIYSWRRSKLFVPYRCHVQRQGVMLLVCVGVDQPVTLPTSCIRGGDVQRTIYDVLCTTYGLWCTIYDAGNMWLLFYVSKETSKHLDLAMTISLLLFLHFHLIAVKYMPFSGYIPAIAHVLLFSR